MARLVSLLDDPVVRLAWPMVAIVACGAPRPSPFGQAETDAALAPARDLWTRCYAGTELERARQWVRLDYDLNVAADGTVRSIPRAIEPEQPTLVECVRQRLNELRFPARGKDRLSVHFELGPRGAEASIPRTDSTRTSGTCAPPCEPGFSCHYEVEHPRGRCRVAPGRCRFARDCAPSQACQRVGEPVGVCVDPRP